MDCDKLAGCSDDLCRFQRQIVARVLRYLIIPCYYLMLSSANIHCYVIWRYVRRRYTMWPALHELRCYTSYRLRSAFHELRRYGSYRMWSALHELQDVVSPTRVTASGQPYTSYRMWSALHELQEVISPIRVTGYSQIYEHKQCGSRIISYNANE